jgi:hypothetical protein
MIPSWGGSHRWNARRAAQRPARRRSVATSLVYLTRPQLTLLLTRSVRSAAKAPTVGATFRESAHTWTRADTSIPLTSYPVRVFFRVVIDLLMLTGCRYKIHAVPYLAAMRLPGPRLRTQASSGRQSYHHPSNPAAHNPQHDRDCPTGPLGDCPACRDVPRCVSCPATLFSTALHDTGPIQSSGRLRHPSRRSIRECETAPLPNRALSRDVFTGAGAPPRTTAPSV